jgi:hypothetical protein
MVGLFSVFKNQDGTAFESGLFQDLNLKSESFKALHGGEAAAGGR